MRPAEDAELSFASLLQVSGQVTDHVLDASIERLIGVRPPCLALELLEHGSDVLRIEDPRMVRPPFPRSHVVCPQLADVNPSCNCFRRDGSSVAGGRRRRGSSAGMERCSSRYSNADPDSVG